MSVAGKSVIVTGSGRGIGAATASLFAERGAKVLVSDINTEGGEEVVRRISADGGTAVFAPADVTDEEAVKGLVQRAVTEFGRLDGIVNNAATIIAKKIVDLTAEEWDRVMLVNSTAVFYGCKHAIRQFQKQGTGGSIVNLGSISALVGLAEQPVYCASKGAVLQLTRQIAMEYSHEGIRCNSVGPGAIGGEFLQQYLEEQGDPDAALDVLRGGHPMGRVGEPREIAEAIVFLTSDHASFASGSNLQIDGGFTAQ